MEKKYEDIEFDLEMWKHEKEGDFVCGIFKSVKKNYGENKSTIYILKQEDGSLIGVWDSAVLKDKIDLIDIGDDIKIIYLGKAKGKKYHNYKIQRASSGVRE